MPHTAAAGVVNAWSRPKSSVAAAALLLLVLALLLRCLFLGRESLWLDEAASWWFSSDSARAWHAEPTNPPLYYVLLHFWTRLFGASETGLRSLSIVPSLLSVWLVFRLARALLSPAIAWGASFYQAISTFQIYYAQEARCYSLLTFVILLSTLLLWKAMENQPQAGRLRYYFAYGVCVALALYVHFIAVFFFVAHGCFVLFRRRRELFAYIASTLCGVLLFAPWLLVLLKAAGGGGQAGRRYLLLKLPQAYFSFMFGDTLIPLNENAVTHLRETLTSHAVILFTAVSVSVVLFAFAWLASRRWGDAMLFVVMNATVPVFVAFVISFKIMLFDERYLIATSPFVYIIVSAAAVEIFSWRPKGAWVSRMGEAAVAGYFCLLLVSLYHYYFDRSFGKEQWRDAVAYVDRASSPGDLLIFDPDFLRAPYAYYQKRDLPYLAATRAILREITASPEALRNRAALHARLWLVTAHYQQEQLAKLIQSYFREESRVSFPNGHGIDISSFRTDSPPSDQHQP